MRQLLSIFIVLLCTVACSKEEYVSEGFTFDHREYVVSSDGGTVTINFSIEGKLHQPQVRCEDHWLDIETLSKTSLKLKAQRNFGGEREAVIYFTNRHNGNSATVIVRQKAFDGKSGIDLTVSDITTRSCTLQAKAKAQRNDMLIVTHLNNYIEYEDNAANPDFTVSEVLYAYSNNAKAEGLTLVEYLEERKIGGYGTVQYSVDNLIPGDTFNFCAFGILYDENSRSYELITPICYKTFDVPTPAKQEIALHGELQVNGADIKLSFAPESWEGYYRYEILSHDELLSPYFPPSESLTEETHREFSCELYSLYHRSVEMGGMSVDDFLSQYCLRGSQEIDLTLVAEDDYLMVAYAVDMVEGIPQIVSRIEYQHFRTGFVEPVDLTVELNITELYGRLVRYELIPSNDHDSYVAALVRKVDFDVINETTLIGMLTQYVDPINGVSYGKTTGEKYLLEPETEYVMCIVGTHGGMITTGLMHYTFKTGAAEACSVEVTGITVGGPYSHRDLYDYGSSYAAADWQMLEAQGYALMWYKIETSDTPYKIFSHIYDTQDLKDYPIENAEQYLMTMESSSEMIYNVKYNEEDVVWCVLMDDKGNLTEIYESEPFFVRREDNRDIEELVAIYDRLFGSTRANNREIGYGTMLDDELSTNKPLVRIL
ncbi:MAG: BACON domain-containing protein [Alistipes sp.]|nr:BACON domain-containing protein [Alistipes sp.]